MRFIPQLALCAILLFAPFAAASHGFVYSTTTPGLTDEDDGAVITAEGNPLNGRTNRVTYPGTTAGDGGLFLDARLATDAEVTDAHLTFAGPTVGRSDLLLPGRVHGSAWYGWWSDADTDGAIDDVHDACGSCPADEFIWRGLSSDETVGMAQYFIPQMKTAPLSGADARVNSGSAKYLPNPESYTFTQYVDRTTDASAQEWVAESSVVVADASTLVTVQTLVVAGAIKVAGSALVYDLDDPNALLDVDRYSAISGDIESVYRSTLSASPVIPVPKSITKVLADAVKDLTEDQVAIVNEIIADTNPASIGSRTINTVTATEEALTLAPYAKEPNHVDDDYGGFALFGGIGDAVGTRNDYGAYATSRHFYFDTLPRARPCGGIDPPVVGSSLGGAPSRCVAHQDSRALDPVGVANGARSSGVHLTFEATPYTWRDINGDTHIGSVCNVNDASFDAERNTCDRERVTNYPFPWPHRPGFEVDTVCAVTSGKGGDITLTPIGGDWPTALILRRHAAVVATTDVIELAPSTGPVVLKWRDVCEVDENSPVGSVGTTLYSRDALILPMGSSVPIRVETRFGILAFRDEKTGLDVGPEWITDVDVLAPTM